MKTRNITRKMLTGILCMISMAGLKAQDNPYTREIEREFSIDNQTRLEISNIYGNVNIMNHDEQTISMQVTIRADIRDRSRAEELLRMVNVNIVEENNVVRAETIIQDNIGRLFRGINIGGGALEISYSVFMPPTVPLELDNKYGNVFIDELTSTSVIDVRYGKLNANRIIHSSQEPLSKIYLAYSDAVIQETSWLNADIKYSKMNITNSRALVILSKYSKVFVTNGSSIVSDSRYDTFELGELNNFVITTSYSNVKIDRLSGKLQADTRYTDVSVSNVPSGFESLKITSSYGNYRIGIDPGASYSLDGYAKHCNINYPESNARVNRINQNNELQINGVVGTNQGAKSEVNINSTYGNVRLVM